MVMAMEAFTQERAVSSSQMSGAGEQAAPNDERLPPTLATVMNGGRHEQPAAVGQEKCQGAEAMVVSRSSSLEQETPGHGDEQERRLAMHVDEMSTGHSSTQKVERASAIASATVRRPVGANRADSLVSQMRDIVQGSAGAKQEPPTPTGSKQAKSSSGDSLNNQQENMSKNSLDSVAAPSTSQTGAKRTRHSRAHCRHHHHHHHGHSHGHHHHHHHHSHRASVSGGASVQGLEPALSDQQQQQQQLTSSSHHHHRHGTAAHRHQHHHHHHHHQHQQQSQSSNPTQQQQRCKRSSIQRPSLALIDPTGSASNLISGATVEHEDSQAPFRRSHSNSSLSSSNSSATVQQRAESTAKVAESKSSGSPADDSQTKGHQVAGTSSQKTNFQRSHSHIHGHAHGHHHHHCHHHQQHNHSHGHHHHHHHHHPHRSHDQKRLVLDVSDQQPHSQLEMQQDSQDSTPPANSERQVLQELSSEINAQQQSQNHQCTRPRHHAAPAHYHHHHHHAHHAACGHHKTGEQSRDAPPVGGQQESVQIRPQPHHHHHHRHHHRHHRHLHHHHQCRAHRRRSKQQQQPSASGSKTNVDEVSKQDVQAAGLATNEQRQQKHDELMARRMSAASLKQQQAASTVAEDEVVRMEMSSSNETSPQRLLATAGESAQSGLQPKQALEPTTTTTLEGGQHHESSYKSEGAIDPNQENRRVGETASSSSSRTNSNKLVRQMSSQSSKRSQKGAPADGRDHGEGDHRQQRQGSGEPAARLLAQSSVINQQPSQPRPVVESSVPTDRRCRLCWCCCCPCSALATNRNGALRNDGSEQLKAAAEPSGSPTRKYSSSFPNVPLEEIRAWGESFDKLMRCTDGRKVFQDFLRCEYSEENILFWSACEELKKERDSKSIAAKARDIYEDYISILSSKEVSLDSRVRDVINHNIKKPTSNIFDEAQLQIYTLMHRDSYPRFINSAMYKKLAQIHNNSSRKSSS